MDDLLAYFQSLLEYAQNNAANLNPASQKALGELILLFSQLIEEQSKKYGPEIPIPPAPYPSSNINGFQYDPESKQLLVKFQGKYPQQNGPVYKYEGVPDFIFNVFSRGAVAPKTSGRNAWHTWKKGVTPSHGAAMAALIKNGGYQYQRMS